MCFINTLLQFDGIIGVIIGFLLGIYLSKKMATHLANQQEFRLACRNFRHTFIPEIQRIERLHKSGHNEQHIIAILKDSAIKHKEAMLEFRYILESFYPNKISAFNNAWLQFSCEDHKQKGMPEYYGYYLTTPENPQPKLSDIKNNAINKINSLLEFADYKT